MHGHPVSRVVAAITFIAVESHGAAMAGRASQLTLENA
jgi:hypothetical protein